MTLQEFLDKVLIKYHYTSKKIDLLLDNKIEYYKEVGDSDSHYFKIFLKEYKYNIHTEKTKSGKNKGSWRVKIVYY